MLPILLAGILCLLTRLDTVTCQPDSPQANRNEPEASDSRRPDSRVTLAGSRSESNGSEAINATDGFEANSNCTPLSTFLVSGLSPTGSSASAADKTTGSGKTEAVVEKLTASHKDAVPFQWNAKPGVVINSCDHPADAVMLGAKIIERVNGPEEVDYVAVNDSSFPASSRGPEKTNRLVASVQQMKEGM
ncbi:unnamed protein product [Protopolystoma xenopodis]|uniref:Uncharacterized protein n=1 Tax=Protopolystoma xenopodis TaxID=117903 RepID=A0A3S5BUK9_9PLAT|nr:unnamed protein product [Protopolystoma xenopodis]